MIKVSVMYPNTPGARFDHAYYRDKHMPLVKARMGDACKSYTVDKGLAGGAPGAPATYVGMCHIFCNWIETFQAGFGLMPRRLWRTSQTIPISLRSSRSVKSSLVDNPTSQLLSRAYTTDALSSQYRRRDTARESERIIRSARFVPSESSTGDKVKRGGITKAGNGRVRRILVEAAWSYRYPRA